MKVGDILKALLVGITTKYDRYDIDYSLNELKNLAETLDYEVIDYPTLTYAYSDNTIASIDGIMVTALKAGTTNVVATASYEGEEVSKRFSITVY